MASFTRDQLEAKGRDEVRRLCTSLGIMGYSKARKDECIDAILRQYGGGSSSAPKAAPSVARTADIPGGMQYFTTAVAEPGKEKGARVSQMVTVLCGALSKEFNVVGYTVGQVSQFLREALNIDKMASAMVNGVQVSGDYVITEKDRILEFIRPAGSKGC
jgi:hypothetical protein